MWITASKQAARQIVRQVSNFADDLGESLIEAKKVLLNDREKRQKNARSLRIAILGLPNAGKSTLINHLIGRPVCAVSSKIHTTRNKAAAILCQDDAQLIFIDTPGLSGRHDFKKYKLEQSFKKDPKNSLEQADVVGVVQDMSNFRAREIISDKIIELLRLTRPERTKSVLVLNKVDTMKNKKVLLDVVKRLTQEDVWPTFSDVFMISALTGDGVDDLRNYFLDSAKPKSWEYDPATFTDQSPETIIKLTVKAALLDDLSQELPYLVNVDVEHLDTLEDGSMNIAVNARCPTNKIARLLIGKSGERVKAVARVAEQKLCAIFETGVRLRLIIPIKDADMQELMWRRRKSASKE